MESVAWINQIFVLIPFMVRVYVCTEGILQANPAPSAYSGEVYPTCAGRHHKLPIDLYRAAVGCEDYILNIQQMRPRSQPAVPWARSTVCPSMPPLSQ